jgi:hypothetical protein
MHTFFEQLIINLYSIRILIVDVVDFYVIFDHSSYLKYF